MVFKQIFENINNSNYTFDFTYKKKFYIFKIDNFLDKEAYNFIEKNFPVFKKDGFKSVNSKYSLSSIEENYKKLLKENSEFLKIHEFFTNQDLSNYFIKKLFFKILKSRISDPQHFFRMFQLRNFNKPKKTILYSNLETRVEYSTLEDKSYINPHTDGVKKMLSLMLYFPERNNGNEFDQQKKYGTEFWSAKEKNFRNIHLRDENEIKNFREKSTIIYRTNFEKYHLYGFIRNANSWHSVKKIDEDKNFLRKSININIFFN